MLKHRRFPRVVSGATRRREGAGGIPAQVTSLLIGAAFAGVAFGAKGGSDLGSLTWVEIALIIVSALVVALAVMHGRRDELDGGTSLLAFVALAALTTLSLLWSIAPDLTWIEANRTLTYLVVFAAGIALARLAPGSWSVLLKGLLLGATAIIGYALASRVWPSNLAANEIYARIGQPYSYWNAVGVTAALAIPPTVWLGARRSGHAPANAVAYPLLGLLIVALFLSYSRGALGAAVVALIIWFAFVPLRVRSLAVLGVSVVGAVPVIVWALSRDAFTKDLVPLSVRESAAGEFGLLLLTMIAVLLAIGLIIGFRVSREAPSPRIRRRVGLAAVSFAILVPLVAFTSVAFSQRGLTGTISNRFHALTSETATTSGGPQRLTQTSSSRGRYWRNAGHIFAAHPLHGTGAGTFGTARLRYRKDVLVARHAHGFFAQTMADMGILGLLVVLAFAAAWLAAVFRTTGGRLRFWRPRPGGAVPWDAERVGVTALALSALVFGLHSSIDWTWFVPGCAVMGIFAAGFVAGRGPVTALAGAGTQAAPQLPRNVRSWLWPKEPVRVGAAAAIALVAILCAWAVDQPERSDSATQDALALVAQGKFKAALSKADHAHNLNPLSPKPLLVRAAVQDSAGDTKDALATLESAVIQQPSNPQLWQKLADYELNRLHNPRAALQALHAELYLDPLEQSAQAMFLEASAAARGQKTKSHGPASPASGGLAPSPGE
jgi:O-antigen ligase